MRIRIISLFPSNFDNEIHPSVRYGEFPSAYVSKHADDIELSSLWLNRCVIRSNHHQNFHKRLLRPFSLHLQSYLSIKTRVVAGRGSCRRRSLK